MAEYRITPIDRLNQVEQVQPVRRRDAGSQFGSMLQREIASASQERESFSVAFSKHARARAEERGIEVTDTLMDQLADSVERASLGFPVHSGAYRRKNRLRKSPNEVWRGLFHGPWFLTSVPRSYRFE